MKWFKTETKQMTVVHLRVTIDFMKRNYLQSELTQCVIRCLKAELNYRTGFSDTRVLEEMELKYQIEMIGTGIFFESQSASVKNLLKNIEAQP